MTAPLKAARADGLARLAAFLPSAGRAYAERRNHDVAAPTVSGLSPYLRRRLVTEAEVVAAVLARHGATAAEKFIDEVFWRAHFKGRLEGQPEIWTRYRADVADAERRLERDLGLARRHADAVTGRTGIACFDAWVEALETTGYLHNHARMWFASIWSHTLGLPWALGAAFMHARLLDGDPAANTLSWRWVVGLHTPGKTYLARADNIERYTNGRFRPEGLATDAPALSEPPFDRAWTAPPSGDAPPRAPFLLLITEEDLHPESLVPADAPLAGVVVADAIEAPWSPRAAPPKRFADEALADAAARAARAFGCAERLALTSEALARAAEAAGTRVIATAYAPIGPTRDALDALAPVLRDHGLDLVRLQRPYDALTWRHGGGGFFGLKKRIPRVIETLGLAPSAQPALL
ncbi:FAD-binding domain-containing protein [uncultured Caulobacter sp.]|uniref:FAD-binding domain-containing protein n=1 Tax=uncultured Caulobacter sp. TaxID=158749 RepID=UPI002606AC74|nr:FAD-binding domain-containing protein [uncultured Caulobacter sp.]